MILGVLAAVALIYLVFQTWQRTTQLAVFWLSAGVVADAAYAKLNDQVPVTVANLLVRLADAIVKLADVMIRSLGVARAGCARENGCRDAGFRLGADPDRDGSHGHQPCGAAAQQQRQTRAAPGGLRKER